MTSLENEKFIIIVDVMHNRIRGLFFSIFEKSQNKYTVLAEWSYAALFNVTTHQLSRRDISVLKCSIYGNCQVWAVRRNSLSGHKFIVVHL